MTTFNWTSNNLGDLSTKWNGMSLRVYNEGTCWQWAVTDTRLGSIGGSWTDKDGHCSSADQACAKAEKAATDYAIKNRLNMEGDNE